MSSKHTGGYNTADPMYYALLEKYQKELRAHPTTAEKYLKLFLAEDKMGYRFRFQHIIGEYIADFVCLPKKLVVELDGEVHDNPLQKEHDAYRTTCLSALGYNVIRFTNDEVLNNTAKVLEIIKSHLK